MGTTQRQARQALAAALDDLQLVTVSSSSSSTFVSGNLINATTSASAERFNAAWVFDGTQQRVARHAGYAPSTGSVTIDPTWTAPAVGTEMEITRKFPSFPPPLGGDVSYRTLLNRAAAKLVIEDRITLVVGTSDAIRLTRWPWLRNRARLVRVYEASPISGRRAVDAEWRGIHLVLDGQTPTLELDVPLRTSTAQLFLEVLRPASTWIATDGVWAETDPAGGYVNDDDECEASVNELVAAGLAEAYFALMNRNPGRPNGEYEKKWAAADAAARSLLRYDATQERTSEAPTEGTAVQPTAAA